MERKTKVHAEDGKQEIFITREFELPVDLLFRAYSDPELFQEWMSHEYGQCKVVKYESRNHGGWHFQTVSREGKVLFQAHGVFHAVIPGRRIVRTFEMNDSSFAPQLEFLEFENTGDDTSKLTLHMVFQSVGMRDEMLKLPFVQGLNMAYDRLQSIVSKLK